MKASFSSICITPRTGLPLAGNGREDSASRGVHDHLYANMAYLEAGKSRLLFIGLDLLGIKKEDCDEIKRLLLKRCGLKEEEIILFATHTHSGPNTVEIFKCFLTEADEEACRGYRKWLINEIAATAPEVLAKTEEMQMGYSRDVVEGCSFNRRVLLRDGTLRMVFEAYDPADIERLAGPNGNPVMSVLAWRDAFERVRGALVHFTSHPAIVCGDAWLYSRDYIDALTVEIQKRYGPDTVVLYANGAQGNLVAADPYKPFVTGFEEAARVGKLLAEGAIKMIDRMALYDTGYKKDWAIQAAVAPVWLPIRQMKREDMQRAKKLLAGGGEGVMLHGLDPRAEGESILEFAQYAKKEERSVIQAIRLDDVIIATFPGELFFEYARTAMSGVATGFVIGLANDYVGYIPTKEAFLQGGYEVKTSYASSRFAPEAGDILVKETKALIKNLQENPPKEGR
ncbi:MAG: hypothetical protein LBS18_01495 [Clostridiales bacterium]|jgi:hypothetical protein|nr:hypothetical protein [Clostridiales bacterium]